MVAPRGDARLVLPVWLFLVVSACDPHQSKPERECSERARDAVGSSNRASSQQAILQVGFWQKSLWQSATWQGHPLEGVFLNTIDISELTLRHGVILTDGYLSGSQLVAWDGHNWLGGSELAGAHLTGELSDGRIVNLYLAEVGVDTASNGSAYPSNRDVYLYHLTVETDSHGWIGACGMEYGMLFSGSWDSAGAWSASGATSFSCSSGFLAQCAKAWGYKPWKEALAPETGESLSLRPFHQGCVRAATADYCGNRRSSTQAGVPIDLFDNYGFHLPATPEEIETAGLGHTGETVFESSWVEQPDGCNGCADFAADLVYAARMLGVNDDAFAETHGCNVSVTQNLNRDENLQLGNTARDADRVLLSVRRPVWSRYSFKGPVKFGSTVGAHDLLTPSCGADTEEDYTPEVAVMWVPPWAGVWEFSSAGSWFDTVLHVRDEMGNELACNDDHPAWADGSLIRLDLDPGDILLVAVDGNGEGEMGYYELSIRPASSEKVPQTCGSRDAALVVGRHHHEIGTVRLHHNRESLTVEIIADGMEIRQSHLHVADSLTGFPQTRSGNPKVGHFEFKREHAVPVARDVYAVPLADYGWSTVEEDCMGSDIVIAVHADMVGEPLGDECHGDGDGDGDGDGQAYESAWAEGEGFPGNNWAMYVEYPLDCCCEAYCENLGR